jgi:hypothetical protein
VKTQVVRRRQGARGQRIGERTADALSYFLVLVMARSHRATTRILFIGNSFTARNKMPDLLAELAFSRGIGLEHRLLSSGGASLRTHWKRGEAINVIKSGNFDFVILQEQSTLPIKNAARMRENVLLFDEAIREAGSRTVLYMTWARKYEPEKQRAITDAYRSIGREIGAITAPVGVAWERFIKKRDAPMLHDKDQSHPTIAGSYLAACVFLEALWDESPVGVNSKLPGWSFDAVKALQEAAHAAVCGRTRE